MTQWHDEAASVRIHEAKPAVPLHPAAVAS
jgi:hypothetical protein